MEGGRPHTAVEVKLSTAPTVSAGFHRACDDLGVENRWVVHPGAEDEYTTSGGVGVIGLGALVAKLREGAGLSAA